MQVDSGLRPDAMRLAIQKERALPLEHVEDFITVPVSQAGGFAGGALQDPQCNRLGPHGPADMPPDFQVAALEGLAFSETRHEAPSLQ